MVRQPPATPTPAERTPGRAVLEAAMAALPTLLRCESGAIVLPRTSGSGARAAARRNLTDPQVAALVDLLSTPEVARMLADGRPFLPRDSAALPREFARQLQADTWPDLIAVPIPLGDADPGVLVAVPDGDGNWIPEKVHAAMQAGELLGAALRAVRDSAQQGRAHQTASDLLASLASLRQDARAPGLAAVVAAVGAALNLARVIAVVTGESAASAEFGRPGAAPIGEPTGLERHPLWRWLGSADTWTYDERSASPADRSAMRTLLNGTEVRRLVAVGIRTGERLSGALLLVLDDTRPDLTDDQLAYLRVVAETVRRDADGEPPPAPPPTDGTHAIGGRDDAFQRLIDTDASALAIAARLAQTLGEIAALDGLLFCRFDDATRRMTVAATAGATPPLDVTAFAPAALGDDVVSGAVRTDTPTAGPGSRALPTLWRRSYRPARETTALAVPLRLETGDRWVLALLSREHAALAAHADRVRALALIALRRMALVVATNDAGYARSLLAASAPLAAALTSEADEITGVRAVLVTLCGVLRDVRAADLWTISDTAPPAPVARWSVSGCAATDEAAPPIVGGWEAGEFEASRESTPPELRAWMERSAAARAVVATVARGSKQLGVVRIGFGRTRPVDHGERALIEITAALLSGAFDALARMGTGRSPRDQVEMLAPMLPEALLVVDADGTVVSSNRMADAILGMSATGRRLRELTATLRLLSPDGRRFSGEELPCTRALRGETVIGAEVLLHHDDGRETRLLVNAGPLAGPAGGAGAICVMQDISQVQELATLKNEFVNTVSHELRTPITTIRGGALTLLRRRQFLDPQTQDELLSDIAEESERLHLLIEDLLALTRSRQGIHVSPEPTLLHRLIDRVIVELGGRIGGHPLAVEVPTTLPAVETDPVLTQQVLRNVLENAVKFSPRAQQIEISAERAGHEIVVSVLDRGSGIPAEDLDRVFEPFYRSERAVQSGTQGAGLGLAVCRRLVELQGGRIWAEARPGGGTAFRFTLRVADDPEGQP